MELARVRGSLDDSQSQNEQVECDGIESGLFVCVSVRWSRHALTSFFIHARSQPINPFMIMLLLRLVSNWPPPASRSQR